MRSANKRVFRIERAMRQGTAQAPVSIPDIQSDSSDDNAQARHREVMRALDEIRQSVGPSEGVSEQLVETCQRDLREAQKIKNELHQIHEAITRTKHEIATLHRGEFQGIEISRMTNELSAIVEGTEQATESILQAAEQIDNNAADLVATLKQNANHTAASDIQDQVIKIFEACNFQDLTGQRISKVVTAFNFIEERVTHMMEIWGGLESFQDLELADTGQRKGDEALLNGPALEDDENIASQDDIDSLFD